MGVADGKGESSRESTSLLGGGSNWHGWGGGAVDFGSSDFQQTILGEAVNAAVTQMSQGLVADAGKLEMARTVKWKGLVAAVDGGQVVLNVGSKAGLKVGDQLTVQARDQGDQRPLNGSGHPAHDVARGNDSPDRCGCDLCRRHPSLRLRLQGR